MACTYCTPQTAVYTVHFVEPCPHWDHLRDSPLLEVSPLHYGFQPVQNINILNRVYTVLIPYCPGKMSLSSVKKCEENIQNIIGQSVLNERIFKYICDLESRQINVSMLIFVIDIYQRKRILKRPSVAGNILQIALLFSHSGSFSIIKMYNHVKWSFGKSVNFAAVDLSRGGSVTIRGYPVLFSQPMIETRQGGRPR